MIPRVAQELNRGLHALFERDERLYLIGEDLLDPYGGAFKVAAGLSTKYPERVLATPLSEGGIVGVAGGLALCGDKVIAEIMFGDFAALGFDQLLNFATKSVSMYGRHVPMSLVVRCPVGGNRGYGPTHSQSPQKHFVGIPNLVLYELSPFHDPAAMLDLALARGLPGVLFEDKVLYTQRMFRDGQIDDVYSYELLGDAAGWAHVHAGTNSEVVIIAPGGLAHRALEAAAADVLVPGQLYPLDLEPVLPVLRSARRIAVVEEGTAGGTWGSEVASRVHERLWSELDHPVLQLSSADSIIPTAIHLERSVLLQADTIRSAVTDADEEPVAGTPITTPKLNNNDTRYLVVEWLRAEGDWVEADDAVVALETSKAVEEIPAPHGGYLHHAAAVGEELAVGDVLGHLVSDRPAAPVVEQPPKTHALSRTQVGTAAVVTRGHQEIPAAFTVVKVDVDDAADQVARLSDRTGATVDLVDLVVKAIADTHARLPLMFGSLLDDHTVALADEPNIGVTLDTGTALYVPVIEAANTRSVSDIADVLMDYRMKAFRGEFAASELAGGNITVSLNTEPDVVVVHPIVLWPQVCMVSLAGTQSELRLCADGTVVRRQYVNLGLAYDHRVINGRDAVLFLSDVKASLEQGERLSRLLAE
ncbi:2-oxo acid dehydrogenase subunit E2 [Actinocrispum wychmicini]|uniref:Dihydrolipoamide acetyltransferase component of pyruvate dehydrogenase complex n=1 Tax=Actinocrispum wychmicini TaxID=1213861 RepID=A0A4V2S3P7_9PSEU|nr:2-oxo acid dehydrogenase subunit E2 [Actinocrispum wychmicini]TCO45240.1 pyruvate/2-oxoglutarate/acetoin dehydrogenase E1 component [Actinocrispum wychmicini]